MMKKSVAFLLSLSLILLSAGLDPWQALAAQTAAPRLTGGGLAIVPAVPVGLGSSLAAPSRHSLSPALTAAPSLQSAPGLSLTVAPALEALPASALLQPFVEAPAAAALTPFDLTMQRLAVPQVENASKDAAGQDFSQRIGEGPAAETSAVEVAPEESRAFPLAASSEGDAVSASGLPVPRAAQRKQARSPLFPLTVAGVLAAATFGLQTAAVALPKAVAWFVPTLSAQGVDAGGGLLQATLGVAAVGAAALGAVFAVGALVDFGVLSYVKAKGRNVSDSDFWSYVRSEVMAGRLDAGAAELLKIHRPTSRFDLDFGYTAGGAIYLRPELIAAPLLFRQTLLHELHHYQANSVRGPPRGRLGRVLSSIVSEFHARAAEFRPAQGLKARRIPVLERVLRNAQISLRLGEAYDVLVVNSESGELKDPAVYQALSGGKARVETVKTASPQDVLGEGKNAGRYQAVVLDQPFALLPAAASADDKRLGLALKQLDSLFVLATRLLPQANSGFSAGTSDSTRYQTLSEQAVLLNKNDKRGMEGFEKLIKQFWREIAATRLKGLAVSAVIENLYKGMRNKGTAFLSFGPTDPGVLVWEKLLRYWEAEDGGQFRVSRVDLENGGHILILRKLETRVGLWLKPLKGGLLETSVANASATSQGREAARKALIAGGFTEHLETFGALEVDIRHVFGADVGRQEIYVTIPRRNAAQIRKLVASSSVQIQSSQEDFRPQLIESGALHQAAPVWQLGITGAGGKILWIDTGADASHEDFGGRLDVVDMVNEGPEDWIGHGTHVAGTSISGGTPYTGMAKGAQGIMAKVFSRESPGASDGDIMGSAAIALQKGVDVINLSLGSRGTSSDNLARFFSQLTHQKNANGEYPFVVASAGNSGPFDQTLSQPAAGEDVNATAAATVGEDDGIAEVSFYSSVGPDVDSRYAIKRLRLKPDITVKGGDVTTEPGSPNVYRRGVYSAKSKDMPKSPSDTEDGKHTGMSGTSMASPMLAGLALLVKLAIKVTGGMTPFLEENMPLALKAVLMRTADDMKLPVWFQGAGFGNAWAAVKLVAAATGASLDGAMSRAWSKLTRALPGRPAAAADAWDWIGRYKAVLALEDHVYSQAELAKGEAQARFEEGATEDPETPPADRQAAGNAIHAEAVKKFNAARQEALPALLEALKDPVWLVRRQAALALLNLKVPESALPLAEAALNDEDGRVRQMAFLALAEIPTHAADVLLQKASSDPRWDTAVYAAYALARHGDRGGVGRIVAELGHKDKWVRFTSAWLLGQLGTKVGTLEAEALSARVKDAAERGNIRHVATAALSNLAATNVASLSDGVVRDLLDASGVQNLALTRTVTKVFPAALKNKAFTERLKAEPLRSIVSSFVMKNKGAVGRPGALGELVGLLARVLGLPLDVPTPLPDSTGAGVAGVDAAMGDLDVLVELPEKSQAPAPSAEVLAKSGAQMKAALPLSRAFWVSVPEHKLFAFTLEMREAGYNVRQSQAKYSASRRVGEAGPGAGLSLTVGSEVPSIPEGADLSLVRVGADAGVSEARLMAMLEAVYAKAGDTLAKPVVIVLSVGGPGSAQSPLSRLLNRLALSNVGVIVPAGNEGPGDNTISSLAKAGLAVVVAAAGRTQGLAGYSARGTPERPTISWTDVVDDLGSDLPSLAAVAAKAARAILGEPESAPAAQPATVSPVSLGTGVAAERSAEKAAALAKRMAEVMLARSGRLPDGYFLYLVSLIKQSLSSMPANQPHEVGAGLFDSPDRALALLETKLLDVDQARADAEALAAEARLRHDLAAAALDGGPSPFQRVRSSARKTMRGLSMPAVESAASALTHWLFGTR
ncbi:MAG: S8 family serine peptidase [Elusimicrobiota bacterium]